jgi:lariat debranching enzyme
MSLKVAVQGCCHGQLSDIYSALDEMEKRNNCKADVLIICGDFQAIRNNSDLETMACPDKYKKHGTFNLYYNEKLSAPLPTIFIGGNHEASNYLLELFVIIT